ncbi:MAG: hydratase [Shewanella sp.]|nr:hydratase [Shewanella sp.]
MNQNIALELAARRLNGEPGDTLCENEKPKDFEDGLSLQQRVSEQYCKLANTHVAGWKCVLPTATTTMLAPLFADSLYDLTPQCPLYASTDDMALIEPEIVSTFAHDLPVRETPYSDAEIEAAIGSTRFALELMQSRYQSPNEATFFEALADGLLNQGVYLGAEVNSQVSIDQMDRFRLTVTAGASVSNNAPAEVLFDKAVTHPNQHPRVGLYWLVNFLSERGIGIQAGQRVITGSYAGIIKVPFNRHITLQYGGLGEIQLEFIRK